MGDLCRSVRPLFVTCSGMPTADAANLVEVRRVRKSGSSGTFGDPVVR
jgi:hypothetical protein